MILLTGATGPTGAEVLKAFVARKLSVRALVGRESSIPKAKAAGAIEAVAGDLRDAAVLARAMAGVAKVYHVCPRFMPEEIAIVEAMIAAARTAGVRHFLYHSVVHGQLDGLPHHRDKRIAESRLMESPLDYTILQPTMYMQSTTRDWKDIVATGQFRLPNAVDRKLSCVDLADVGEAAAIAATDASLVGGCYELCSGDVFTRAEYAQLMGEAIGKPVVAVRRDPAEWRAEMAHHGTFAPAQLDRLAAMHDHYDRFGLSGGSGRVLAMILGRRPTSYREYIARVAKGG